MTSTVIDHNAIGSKVIGDGKSCSIHREDIKVIMIQITTRQQGALTIIAWMFVGSMWHNIIAEPTLCDAHMAHAHRCDVYGSYMVYSYA